MENVTRRKFIIQSSKLLAFIPLASVIGCMSDSNLDAEDSLKKLIYIIGPWTIDDNLIAKDFARRFLKTSYSNQYLSKSVTLIQSLSKQISKKTEKVKEIDLENIPKKEKEMLINLSKQLYSFVEVRFYASNEPLWGQCQNNSNWHMRIPK